MVEQKDKITIDQKEYMKNLECVNIKHHIRHNLSELLSNNRKDVLRQKVGQWLWVCNQSRPDICFDVSNIAFNIKNATIKLLIDVNKTINKTKINQHDLKFKPIENQSNLVAYVGAAFGDLHNGRSLSVYLIFFVNPNEKFNLISWQSKRIKTIVHSSLATEPLAKLDGIDLVLYIAALLN